MDWPEVKAWRKAARQKILAARAAIAMPIRQAMSQRIIERLREVLQDRPEPISFYWPIKAEPDLRPLMQELDAAGVALCLPVARRVGEPLTFRPWRKGVAMTRGLWNIPMPAAEDETDPRTLVAPLVGYDPGGYRLGYGGGFFDRTLAKYGADGAAVGVGFTPFLLPTIHPQPHDIPMTRIVTQIGILPQPDAGRFSEVCYLNEAEDAYAGFNRPEETAAVLESLRGSLAPERVGLLDYALWRLDAAPADAPASTGGSPTEALRRLLPRIRDDALHATIAALHASLVV